MPDVEILVTRGIFEKNILIIEEPYIEEKEKEVELRFPRDKTLLRIEGSPFTHTKLGTPIEIIQGDQKYSLTISLIEGAGDFALHLSYGKPMEGNLLMLTLKALRRDDKVKLEFKWASLTSSSS